MPQSLCKDTKSVMCEIHVERYRVRDIFNSMFISLPLSLSIYLGYLGNECRLRKY